MVAWSARRTTCLPRASAARAPDSAHDEAQPEAEAERAAQVRDAEQEVLERLTEIRRAVAGEVKDAEVNMAHMLVETLAGDFDADAFEDDYAAAVQSLVEAKLEGGEVKRTKEPAPSAGEVVDLLAALQKSVAAAKTARGEDPGDVEEAAGADTEADNEAEDEKPARKAASKKSGSKKSESKKKPAKKKTTTKTMLCR